jgi:hypothetical protein
MKIFGSIRELVDVVFRRNGNEITIKPESATPGESQTFLLPDANTTANQTLVTTALGQTLTNKTIDADANSISNIDDGNIKTGANIDRSKLLIGSANHVVVNDGSGVLSSEAQLASTKGGTGVSNAGTLTYGANNVVLSTSGATSLTLPTSGTVATTSNKLNAFASTSSSELVDVISDETGGSLPDAKLVFSKSPVLDSPGIVGYVLLDDQASAIFREASVNGNNQVTVKAQASLAANYTLELPADGGASGNVLTKGAGNLTEWTAPLTFSAVETTTGTFTNKTFDADGTGNVLSNVDNDNIKTGANIARNKLASGALGEENHVLINNGSGVMSSEAALASTRGGTGVSNSGTLTYGANNVTLTTSGATSLTLPTTGTIATTSNDLGDFATTSSSALAGVISDGTGSGSLVFATSPALTTPTIASSATMLNQAGINFREDVGNGTAAATLRGPVSLAANYTLELPATAGSAGQVLTKGASNTTEWSSPLTNPMDSAGDLIKGGSGGATVKLDLGAADYVVKANTAGTDTEFGQIVNASVASSAAIAGTKISPDFGSQNVTTTGSVTGGSLKVSSNSFLDGNSTTTQVRVQADNTPVALFQRFSGSSGRLSLAGADGSFGGLEITADSSANTATIRPDRTDTRLDLGVRFNPSALTIRGVNNASANGDYNGYVGIGTTAPAYNLTVQNNRTDDNPLANTTVYVKSAGRNASLELDAPTTSYSTSIVSRLAGTEKGRIAYNMVDDSWILRTNPGRAYDMLIGSTGILVVPQNYNRTTASAANVFVNPAGDLVRSTSSIKYKRDIEPVEPEYFNNIYMMEPVYYRSKSPNDNPEWSYWGLIAEDLAEVDPRLVHWKVNEDGTKEAEGVMYERLSVLLLGAIKAHRAEIDSLKADLAALSSST